MTTPTAAELYRENLRHSLRIDLPILPDRLHPEDLGFLYQLLIDYDCNFLGQPLGLANAFQLTISVRERVIVCRDDEEWSAMLAVQEDLRNGGGWRVYNKPHSNGASHA
jgi:hypothetical protein